MSQVETWQVVSREPPDVVVLFHGSVSGLATPPVN